MLQIVNDASIGAYRVQNHDNKLDFTWDDKKYKYSEFKDLRAFYYEGCREKDTEVVCGTSYVVLKHPFDNVAIKVEFKSHVKSEFNTMITMNVIPGVWN